MTALGKKNPTESGQCKPALHQFRHKLEAIARGIILHEIASICADRCIQAFRSLRIHGYLKDFHQFPNQNAHCTRLRIYCIVHERLGISSMVINLHLFGGMRKKAIQPCFLLQVCDIHDPVQTGTIYRDHKIIVFWADTKLADLLKPIHEIHISRCGIPIIDMGSLAHAPYGPCQC